VIDFAYVIWVAAVNAGSPWLAGIASVFVALPALLGYLAIVNKKALIGPYLLGLFFGTVCTVYFL